MCMCAVFRSHPMYRLSTFGNFRFLFLFLHMNFIFIILSDIISPQRLVSFHVVINCFFFFPGLCAFFAFTLFAITFYSVHFRLIFFCQRFFWMFKCMWCFWTGSIPIFFGLSCAFFPLGMCVCLGFCFIASKSINFILMLCMYLDCRLRSRTFKK